MRTLPLLFLAAVLSGCANEKTSLFKASPERSPATSLSTARKNTRVVRTTAYCHLEDGNRRNAISGPLASGHFYSAAADWSRFPVGTVFRLPENGRTYVVDDYGSALVGSETIDLYVPSMREMRNWGVRHVNIEILQHGDSAKSLSILRPRAKRSYIRRMVRDLETKAR